MCTNLLNKSNFNSSAVVTLFYEHCYCSPCLPSSIFFIVFFLQWATVTFHLPHHVLKLVAGAIVSELKKINQNIAALSVASSIMDRLSYLLSSARPELGVGPGRSVDRLDQQRSYLMSLGISLFWVINTQLFIAFHSGHEHSLKISVSVIF